MSMITIIKIRLLSEWVNGFKLKCYVISIEVLMSVNEWDNEFCSKIQERLIMIISYAIAQLQIQLK